MIRISQFHPYFTDENLANGLIQFEEWYLHPVAYTLTLIPKEFPSISEINEELLPVEIEVLEKAPTKKDKKSKNKKRERSVRGNKIERQAYPTSIYNLSLHEK